MFLLSIISLIAGVTIRHDLLRFVTRPFPPLLFRSFALNRPLTAGRGPQSQHASLLTDDQWAEIAIVSEARLTPDASEPLATVSPAPGD